MCPDGWAAARMLVAQAAEYSTTPGARDLALSLRSGAIDDEAFARAVHAFVKANVAFVREAGEVFQGPAYTLARGAGDCDDQALLMLTIAMAGGLPALAAFLHNAGKPAATNGPTHAAVLLCPHGECQWAETTVDAHFGEHPLAAAQRVGVLKTRGDLSTEVVTMSQKDLAPLPPDYVDVNPPALVEKDSAILAGLGLLADPNESDPTCPAFREAVAAFQRSHSLTVDGLIGPQTRAAMGELGLSALTAHLPDQFFADVAQVARDFQAKGATITPADLLGVFLVESDVHPTALNSLGFAGLNQLGKAQRAATGFVGEAEDFAALSAVAQLPFVRKYFELNVKSFAGGDWSKLADAGSLYLMNFEPARMAHADDSSFVLASRSPGDDGSAAFTAAHPGDVYAQNRGLDVGKKGWIEVGDMAKVVAGKEAANPAYWAELNARLSGAAYLPPSSGGSLVATAAAVVGILVGAALIGTAASLAVRA